MTKKRGGDDEDLDAQLDRYMGGDGGSSANVLDKELDSYFGKTDDVEKSKGEKKGLKGKKGPKEKEAPLTVEDMDAQLEAFMSGGGEASGEKEEEATAGTD